MLGWASRWLLVGTCVPLVVFAIAISWLRLGVNSHPLYHQWVQTQVSQAIGQELIIEAFSVQLVGDHLQLNLAGVTATQELSLAQLSVGIDVSATLLDGRLNLSYVQATGLALNMQQQSNGDWGPVAQAATEDQANQSNPAAMLAIAARIPNLLLRDMDLSLTTNKGKSIRIANLNATIKLTHDTRAGDASNVGVSQVFITMYGFTNAQATSIGQRMDANLRLDISPDHVIQKAFIYLQSDGLDVRPWLIALTPNSEPSGELGAYTETVQKLNVKGEYWLNYTSAQKLELVAQGAEFEIESAQFKAEISGNASLVSEWGGAPTQTGSLGNWRLAVTQLKGLFNEVPIPVEQMFAQSNQGSVALASPKLHLDRTRSILQSLPSLPAKINTPIQALAPKGWINNAQLHFDTNQPKEFLFTGKMQQASIEAWLGVPYIERAEGQIWLNRYGGKVSISDDDGISVRLPNLTTKPWLLTGLDGEFSWRYGIQSNRFSSSNMEIKLQQGKANLVIEAEFPRKGSTVQPMLQLSLGMQNLDLAQLPQLLPDQVLGQQLGQWLNQATPKGRVTQAGLIYHGQLGKGKVKAMPIMAHVSAPLLTYDADWPVVNELEAKLYVNSKSVVIKVEKGHINTAQLTQSVQGWQVEVPVKPGPGKYISVDGHVLADATAVMALAEQLPINLTMPAWLQQVQPQGTVTLDGKINIAFGHQEKPEYNIILASEDVSGHWAPLKADLSHVQLSVQLNSRINGVGEVTGSGLVDGQNITLRRLSSPNYDAYWLADIPDQFKIKPGSIQPDMVLELRGRMPSGYLSGKFGYPWLQQIEGELPFVARFSTCMDSQQNPCTQLSAKLDLTQAELALPTPIGQLHELQLLGDWQNEQQHWYAAIGPHRISLALGQIEGGSNGLGKLTILGANLAFQQQAKRAQPGLWAINGQLEELTVEPWWQLYQKHIQPVLGDADDGISLLPKVDVKVKEIDWNELVINHASISLEPLPEAVGFADSQPWRLRLTSEQLAGQVDYFGAEHPLSVHIDYARFDFPEPESEINQDSEAEAQDILEHIDPSKFPDADVTIDELVKNGEPFGQWEFKTRRNGNQVNVHDLEAFIRQAHLQGNLIWSKVDGLHQTDFTGRVATKDMAALLIAWGYDPSLAAESAAIEVQLQWPHSPLAFAIKEITGDLGLRLKQGHFASSSNAASGLKILALLDMGRLMKRVRLDFSDVLEPGLSFDSMVAHYRFEHGLATTVMPLRLKSSSLNLTIKGWIDFNQRQVDNDLVMTLPVADKLPLAALVVGLPQLSGAIYIVNKLIGGELETFTSARYQIIGSLDNPEVELVRMFDKDYQQQSVKERIKNVISIE